MSQARQDLILFKRHTARCAVHKSRVPVSKCRFWFECDCPIWIEGRTPQGDVVPRQTTGFRDLPQAEALRASLIAKHSPVSHGATIEECIEKYLASRRHELGERTYSYYRVVFRRLKDFCAAHGVLHMRDLTVDLLETFKTEGLPAGMKDTSKAKSVEKMRCWLRDAHRRGWITEALAERVKPHRAMYEQKEPYTDEEVDKILAEALKRNGGTHGYAKHPKTFRLLLELMLETGIRVGDAVRYNPRAVVKGEYLWVYSFTQQKKKRLQAPKTVKVYLPDALKVAIDRCEWFSPKLPFFYDSLHLATEVYSRMQTIGSRCDIQDCRPHRLRDTFAIRKLLAGMQLEDVSRLLGHSSVKVTELYYAKWVTARESRLERLVAESLVNS